MWAVIVLVSVTLIEMMKVIDNEDDGNGDEYDDQMMIMILGETFVR